MYEREVSYGVVKNRSGYSTAIAQADAGEVIEYEELMDELDLHIFSGNYNTSTEIKFPISSSPREKIRRQPGLCGARAAVK